MVLPAFIGFEIVIGVLLILLAVVVIGFLKNLFANTVLGVGALLVLNILADYAKMETIKIPITIVTVLISALLGLAGLGLMIILKLLGIVIQ
ncbi:pro-sigmaK processing inhibitor BofA family protein [Candidatus Micrarchaeota archaeon]|nr:pro-sigmaK processing inhibitor BofA family protein [Candidatus Micrarchaeota archaeon]